MSSAYLKELRQWPLIKYGDAKAYKSFFHFLKKCKVLKMQGQLASLDSVETIRSVVCKFPPQVQESWNRKVLGIKETKLRESDFSDLVDFADYQSQLVNNPEYSRDAFSEIKDRSSANPRVRNFLIGGTEQKKASGCYLCSSNHLLDSCGTFAEMTLEGRLSFIKERRLCFGCLLPTNPNHYYRVCERKMTCTICNGKHPTSLHEGNIQRVTVVHTQASEIYGEVVSLSVVPVEVWHEVDPSKKVSVYALLDECSQGTFISKNLQALLPSIEGRETTLTIQTVSSSRSVSTTALNGLVSCSTKHGFPYPISNLKLPTSYTQENIPVDLNEIPTAEKIAQWPYLNEIADYLPVCIPRIPVGLLIGANVTKALEPHEVVASDGPGPYAKRSVLGWCIDGPIETNNSRSSRCHNIVLKTAATDISTNKLATHHFESIQRIKEDAVARALYRMYMLEFSERDSEKKAMSRNDEKFIDKMKRGVKHEHGYYSLPLPFIDDDPKMPNNKGVAKKRCLALGRKMQGKKRFGNDYQAFMNDLLANGHAKEVKSLGIETEGNRWYIPHHGVYHAVKDKIRVVFNCAEKCEGKSLNDIDDRPRFDKFVGWHPFALPEGPSALYG